MDRTPEVPPVLAPSGCDDLRMAFPVVCDHLSCTPFGVRNLVPAKSQEILLVVLDSSQAE
jgi:hypothetical protein